MSAKSRERQLERVQKVNSARPKWVQDHTHKQALAMDRKFDQDKAEELKAKRLAETP